MGKKCLFSLLFFAAICFTTADSLFGLLTPRGETVSVPNFCGLTEGSFPLPDWADVTVEYRYDDVAPAGEVTAQAPVAGSQRRITDRHPCEITLTVSLGEKKPAVPQVVGQDASAASAAIRNAGLHVRTVSVRGGERGTVARTEPVAGTELSSGSEVTLYLYTGEAAHAVSVPDLTGLSRSRALLTIYLSGLSAGEVAEEPSEDADGTVIRQSPPPGSLVANGTRVHLTVGQPFPEE